MDRIKRDWALLILIVLYAVGTVGFLSEAYMELFAPLTPLHLLITTLLLLFFHPSKSLTFWASVVAIGVAGFVLEWAGTTTGLLFGEYHYGETLGFKCCGVPLMIGVNWVLMVYVSASIARRWSDNILISSLLAGALMTLLDVLIEPFAMYFDLWSWAGDVVPLQNYAMWFIAGTIFNYVFQKLNPDLNNRLAIPLFILMALFFLIIDAAVIWQ